MKTMISSFALAATLALFSGCSDDLDPVLTQKDWDGTTTYFDPTDEMSFATYYNLSRRARQPRLMPHWVQAVRCIMSLMAYIILSTRVILRVKKW